MGDPHCASCLDQKTCLECSGNKHVLLKGPNGITACYPCSYKHGKHCTSCDKKKCGSCSIGSYLDRGFCNECDKGCADCDFDGCKRCKDGFEVKVDDKKQKTCIEIKKDDKKDG